MDISLAVAFAIDTIGNPSNSPEDSRSHWGSKAASAVVESARRDGFRFRASVGVGGFQVQCDKFRGIRNAQDGGVGGLCQSLATAMRRRPSRRWLSRGPGTLLAFRVQLVDTRQYRSNAWASKPSVIHIESLGGVIWRWRARRQCDVGGFIVEVGRKRAVKGRMEGRSPSGVNRGQQTGLKVGTEGLMPAPSNEIKG